jgi:hypothetical protein
MKNGHNALWKPLLSSGLLCLLWGHAAASHAQDTVTVCGGIEHVLIPPTYKEVMSGCNCRRNKLRIPIDPTCCLPGICSTLPHCVITSKVIDVAEHWEDRTICREVDPKEEFTKWLQGQLPVLPVAVMPGAYETIRADLETMRLAGHPIPEYVRVQIRALTEWAGVSTAFTDTDLDNARLLGASHSKAPLYMPSDLHVQGITYDSLILLRERLDEQLTTANDYTAEDIISDPALDAYQQAIETLIHELVHVRQYREMGFDTFMGNYVLQVLQAVSQALVEEDAHPTKAADSIALESEAYGIEHTVQDLAARQGMTWAKHAHDTQLGTDFVGCAGCSPYVGNTGCGTELPILCIKKNGYADPGVTPSGTRYDGWTGGHIATTLPTRGFALRTLADADALCQSYFGDGWRTAEFHDGNGDWNWHAVGDVRSDVRFWVHISNQPGNCWR